MTLTPFLERIQRGEILISDGATGTNLQARGLKSGAPAETLLFERPDEILRLHRDFVEAGADILLTCTFGGSPLRLEHAGMPGKVDEVSRAAVSLARQAAAERPVYVAGSIGPLGQLIQPYGPLEPQAASASYGEQARALTEAGVDFLVIETQFDLNEASLAFEAARLASRLPVVVSFSYDRGVRTMMGVKPVQMAERFAAADVLGVNCGRSLDENLQVLRDLRAATSLPLWFKPNAGMPHLDAQRNTVFDLTPEGMGASVPEWIAAGAAVVGGCCGTSPDHLRAIAQAAKERE